MLCSLLLTVLLISPPMPLQTNWLYFAMSHCLILFILILFKLIMRMCSNGSTFVRFVNCYLANACSILFTEALVTVSILSSLKISDVIGAACRCCDLERTSLSCLILKSLMLSESSFELLLENFVIPAKIIYTNSILRLEDKNVDSTSALIPCLGSSITTPKYSKAFYLSKNLKYGSKTRIITIIIPVKYIA